MGRIRQVRKDDGTLVPFRERKVVDAVHEALRTSGTEDPALADELAGVVMLFLEKYHAETVPSVHDVEELLVRVLRETGHPRAARVFEDLQRERRRLHEELTVRAATPGGADVSGGAEETRVWDRGRMVRSLMEEREVPESLAEEIAAAVERRLIRSGLRSVTTVLLAELVEYELLDRGLEANSARERTYGIRRSDLLEALRRDTGGELPDRAVAAQTLARYALGEIHAAPTARAHRDGLIHIHGLGDPLKVERIVLGAALVFRTVRPPEAAQSLLELRVLLDVLRDHVRSEILLPDLVASLAATEDAARDPARLAELLLLALDGRNAYGRPAGPLPHLVVPLDPPPGAPPGAAEFLAALLDRALAPEHGERLPLTLAAGDGVLPAGADARVRAILERGAARAATHLSVARAGDPPLQPPDRVLPQPLRVSLGRVAINLPLAFVDAHGHDLSDALSCLDAAGRFALAAFTERFWHQRSGSSQGLHGIVVRLGGPGQVQVSAQGQEVDLEIWGLSHALELLVRRGLIRRTERPKAAARILHFLDYLLGEEVNGVRFRVRLGGAIERDVRRRFLDALESWSGRYGVADMQALLREGRPERTTLPVVVPLLTEANAPLLDASFAERLAPGLALPLAAFGEAQPSCLLAQLAQKTRLGLVSLAPRRPGDDLFEVQEELF